MKMTLRSGFITKLVLLLLIVYLSITLINNRGKIQAAGAELAAMEAKVAAQEAENAELRALIQNKDDEATWLRIAKERLGLAEKGEIVFYDSAK